MAAASKYHCGVGKRKTAIARVRLYPNGKGDITVNGKPLSEFCNVLTQKKIILSPLKLIEKEKNFDVTVKVIGGGFSAQAEAIRHGISRALLNADETIRTPLKKAGFLRRDSRIKERKKFGLKRARRAPQFSKR